MGSIRNKNNWNNASKRLFGSYSHSGIPGFPFRLFYSQEKNSRNIFRNKFLFRNIPNERALKVRVMSKRDYLQCRISIVSSTSEFCFGFHFHNIQTSIPLLLIPDERHNRHSNDLGRPKNFLKIRDCSGIFI